MLKWHFPLRAMSHPARRDTHALFHALLMSFKALAVSYEKAFAPD